MYNIKQFAELHSPAFVFWERTWFTAEISLAQQICADSAGPTIILSCFLANWLLQGSNSKTWKRNVLNNPPLLVPPSSVCPQICHSCTRGHGSAQLPHLQAVDILHARASGGRDFVIILSNSQGADFSAKYCSSDMSCHVSVMFHFADLIGTAKVTNALLAQFCTSCCFFNCCSPTVCSLRWTKKHGQKAARFLGLPWWALPFSASEGRVLS